MIPEPTTAASNLADRENPAPPEPNTTRPPSTATGDALPPLSKEMIAVPGYEIFGELGRGGMGVVYKARHLELNRVVALKMILSGALAGDEQVGRFRAEAEAVAKLHHPNIVQIYDIGESEGRPYFSLEFVEGGSLAAKLHGDPQPPRQAAQLVETLARAMQVAHQAGIVHRDLKPANVLLQLADGRWQNVKSAEAPAQPSELSDLQSAIPKITDFGLAKRLDADIGQTRTGAVLGTPSYMAPEQAGGQVREIGPATDVYALGAVLYELLTGRPPFRAATPLDTILQVLEEEPVPPRRLQSLTPRDLDTICLKCLEKEPGRRYATAAALADDLRRYLEDRPILARPIGRWEQARKFARRNKLLVGSLSGIAAALILGIIGTTIGMTEARKAEGEAQENFKRAKDAERQLRLSFAIQATTQGNWSDAVRLYDQAVEAGAADEPALRLKRTQALVALYERDQARAELDRLVQRSDLPASVRAGVLLLRGDLALALWEGRDQALADVRAALEREADLPPADAAYAHALLEEWPRDAEVYLRKTLEIDPFHYHARNQLLAILMVQGKLDESRNQAEYASLQFPRDPWPRVFSAVVASLQGDSPRSAKYLAQLRNQVGQEQIDLLREICKLVSDAVRLFQDQDEPIIPPSFVPRILALASKFQKSSDRNLERLGAELVNLPAIRNIWGPEFKFLQQVAFLGPTVKGMQELEKIVAHHDEALAHFVYAESVMATSTAKTVEENAAVLRKAEASFRKATEAPSLIPSLEKDARYWAAYAQAILAKSQKFPPDAEMRTRALENMRRLLAERRLGAGRCAILSELARNRLGEYDLARALVAEGQRKAPHDLGLLRERARVELAAGAYHPAILAADQVLAKESKDAEMLRIRQEAIDKLQAAKTQTAKEK
jgi:serine/threonine protein kinase